MKKLIAYVPTALYSKNKGGNHTALQATGEGEGITEPITMVIIFTETPEPLKIEIEGFLKSHGEQATLIEVDGVPYFD